MPPDRRRNLIITAGAAAAIPAAVYSIWLWVTSFLSDNFHNDFTFYYAATRVGLREGWNHLYDLDLLQRQLDEIGSGITVAQLARYVSPPPLAWLVTPFTVLPFQAAYLLWSALLVAMLVLTWCVSAPGAGRARIVFLVAAIGWLPVIYGLQLGQPALLVGAGVACSCWLLKRDQPLAAGAVLAALVLKPQLALLVPAALVVTGRWRAFAAVMAALAVLTAASLIALGPHGAETYLERLSLASIVPENRSQTLAAWLPDMQLARVVQVAIAIWTLGIAYRWRRGDPRTIFAIAVVGGLAASPYTHYDDLTMLGLAILLYLGSPDCVRGSRIYALGLVVAAEGFPVWGAGPVLAGELGVLVLLSVAALKHHDRNAEEHDSEGEHHPDLERDRQHLSVDGQP